LFVSRLSESTQLTRWYETTVCYYFRIHTVHIYGSVSFTFPFDNRATDIWLVIQTFYLRPSKLVALGIQDQLDLFTILPCHTRTRASVAASPLPSGVNENKEKRKWRKLSWCFFICGHIWRGQISWRLSRLLKTSEFKIRHPRWQGQSRGGSCRGDSKKKKWIGR
jgi:hypothetical protein